MAIQIYRLQRLLPNIPVQTPFLRSQSDLLLNPIEQLSRLHLECFGQLASLRGKAAHSSQSD